MGIREDIANVIGSITATMPEAAHTLRHGTASGKVVQSSARDFAEAVSEVGPAEVARYIATAADFPELDKGAAVELDGSLRVVVSLKTDPIGATYTVGMSDTFDDTRAIYSGTRREDGTVHKFRHTVDILCIRSASEPPELTDAAAFSCEQSWLAAVAVGVWPELTEPRPSDLIEFPDPKRMWETVRLRVASVVRHGGWWILRARPRGGA